jgi:hypothetical protein
MAYKVKKTAHSGAKHGRGPLTRHEVKSGSRKVRRRHALRAIREELQS